MTKFKKQKGFVFLLVIVVIALVATLWLATKHQTLDGSFFQDLYDGGFIKSPTPKSVFGSGSYFFANYLANNASVSKYTGTILGANQVCVTNLLTTDVVSFESAFDDLEWNAGNFRTDSAFDSSDSHTLCIDL
jgi:hypothetical protein